MSPPNIESTKTASELRSPEFKSLTDHVEDAVTSISNYIEEVISLMVLVWSPFIRILCHLFISIVSILDLYRLLDDYCSTTTNATFMEANFSMTVLRVCYHICLCLPINVGLTGYWVLRPILWPPTLPLQFQFRHSLVELLLTTVCATMAVLNSLLSVARPLHNTPRIVTADLDQCVTVLWALLTLVAMAQLIILRRITRQQSSAMLKFVCQDSN